MEVLLLADENLGNALEPALRRAGFSVERAANSDALTSADGRLVVAPLKLLRESGKLLKSAPGTLCVLLPPGRESDRAALLAAGAAEVFESPIRSSTVAARLSELARARATAANPVEPAPEPPQGASAPAPAPAVIPPSPEPAVAAASPSAEPAAAPSLASQLFDTRSWPAQVPPLETAREALVVRARGDLGGSDQLGEVFRTLSEPELEALRATAPTSDDDLLVRGAAQRLLVRHVAEQAATLRREETLVEIDSAALAALRDATNAIATELEAAVDRAVREDPEAFQRLAPSRAGITRALRELENAARLLRGDALLEDSHPLDVAVGAAPPAPRVTPRKAVVTTYYDVPAPPPPRRARSGFVIVLGVVAVAVALVHVFVLGTFRSPRKDAVTPAGVVAGIPLVRHGGVLEARVPPTPDVAHKATELGQHERAPLVIATPEGQPIGFEVRGTFVPAPGFQALVPPPPTERKP